MIAWTSPTDITIAIDNDPGMLWRVSLSSTPATRVMNAIGPRFRIRCGGRRRRSNRWNGWPEPCSERNAWAERVL